MLLHIDLDLEGIAQTDRAADEGSGDLAVFAHHTGAHDTGRLDEILGELAVLGVAVISLGWAFHRRFSRYNRRRAFAEANGLDVFDQEAVDRAMEEAGLLDRRKKSWF